jgi:hypothetical protein
MSNILAKFVANGALLTAAFVIAYFNMTLTWGLVIVSWPYFFLFWFLSVLVHALLTLVNHKDEN